jgi:hypothetical protein
MTPTTIQFRAQPAVSCRGGLFEPESSYNCMKACEEAVKRGLPDCEDAKGYIYVADEVDPRQMSLEVAPC